MLQNYLYFVASFSWKGEHSADMKSRFLNTTLPDNIWTVRSPGCWKRSVMQVRKTGMCNSIDYFASNTWAQMKHNTLWPTVASKIVQLTV